MLDVDERLQVASRHRPRIANITLRNDKSADHYFGGDMRVPSDNGTAGFFRAPIIRPGFTADRAEVKMVM